MVEFVPFCSVVIMLYSAFKTVWFGVFVSFSLELIMVK